ncbi:MAG: energy-coupled thiamine transporter ThiT [Clostridia bacterium]|nr:energy-coupled thiamine transporter ThiT [Clostridia bacterium]
MHNKQTVNRLTTTAMMLAIAVVLAVTCQLIPFLNLPFGGGFTIASMLPIVLVSYLYGVPWGLFAALTYSFLQILMDLMLGPGGSTIMALFMPTSDDFMGYFAAIAILLLDYLVAYTVLGLGGIFRTRIKNKTLALCLGAAVALSLRYLVHILSGYIFYGAWAEWFFSQEGFPLGEKILQIFSGQLLAILYSIVYNGLYMLPEIVITTVAAAIVSRIPVISPKKDANA